ncbi:unnamed protein product, partial [Didymodactylos carnosus]
NYNASKGLKTLQDGKADAIVFGRLYISNPDLASRLIKEQELNTNYDMTKGWGCGSDEYTSYPTCENRLYDVLHDHAKI